MKSRNLFVSFAPTKAPKVAPNATSGDDEYLVIDGDDRVAGLATTEKVHVDLLYSVADALRPTA